MEATVTEQGVFITPRSGSHAFLSHRASEILLSSEIYLKSNPRTGRGHAVA